MWWGHGFNAGWMIFGGLMMFLFWGTVIALLIFAIRGGLNLMQTSRPATSSSQQAIYILQERYARGELSQSEYEAMRTELSG